MRNKPWLTFRWKIVLMFVASILLAVLSVLFLILIVYNIAILDRNSFLFVFLHDLRWRVGVVPIAAGFSIIVAIAWFFFLSRGTIRYLEEIADSLQGVTLGNFELKIPVNSADELGMLAENLNLMTSRLQAALEEERNAERSKNDLITSVSHDLRTPLTSVLGYLELIVKDQYRDEVELRYYIEVAYEKAVRLQKLIDDLFEYTKVSYGGLKLETSIIDLHELLEQLAEEFVPALQDADMQYRLFIPKGDYHVSADGDLLVRVFENLVSNAIRYGQNGKYVDIELHQEQNNIFVQVANYGDPIPQNDLPYIFDRFYRVEQSRSEKMGGSGLGLAIAKNITELHAGKISAYVSQNKTIFEVQLPAATIV